MEKLKNNVLYSFIYQFLAIILPLATAPYVSRILGPEGIGTISYSKSIALYFSLFALLGLNTYGVRVIASSRNNNKTLTDTFNQVFTLQLVTAILIVVMYSFYVFLILPPDSRLYAIIFIGIVMSTCVDVNWFFFGIERFKITVVRNGIIKILATILIFVLVKGKNDLWVYALILSSSQLFSNIVLMKYIKDYVSEIRLTTDNFLVHFKNNLVLFVPVIAVSVYKILDKIILTNIGGPTQTGFFESAEMIILAPLTFVSALGSVMLPRITFLKDIDDSESVNKIIRISTKLTLAIAIPLSFGIASIATPFTIIFFGESFKNTGLLIEILAPVIVLTTLSYALKTQFLIPMKKDKEYTISVILGAIINVIINVLLVPTFGALGTSIGVLLSEIVVLTVLVFVLRKGVNFKIFLRGTWIYFISGVLMFCLLKVLFLVFSTDLLALLASIIIGFSSYLTIITLLLYFFDKGFLFELVLLRK